MNLKDELAAQNDNMMMNIDQIRKKQNKMNIEISDKLTSLEDTARKDGRRLLMVERESAVQKQDLAAHTLMKRRQIDNLEEKAWELRDFKEELQRQLTGVLEHAFNITESCAERVESVQTQFKTVKEPLIHQISNLISQNELMQREIGRSQ